MKPILKNNETELYTKCEDITSNEQEIITEVLESFINPNYHSYCLGVGLAANQIGYNKNFIVISERAKAKEIFTMANPVILNHGKDIIYGEEMCLSYPKRKEIVGRYRVIDVKYFIIREILVISIEIMMVVLLN